MKRIAAMLLVTIIALRCCVGCVSPGDFDKMQARAKSAEDNLARVEDERHKALDDLAEARACLQAVLDYLDAKGQQIERQLFGGH